MKASLVAEYILSLSSPEEGDIISHLKLQKLLYYAQGFHLALTGCSLFEEDILNWPHGPVVKEVYDIYKSHGRSALPVPENTDFSSFTTQQKSTIDEAYNVYGQFSAWKLRQMTHEEPPWQDTNENDLITHDALKAYFKSQLN